MRLYLNLSSEVNMESVKATSSNSHPTTIVNLHYWDARANGYPKGRGNFGDELSPYIVSRLLDRTHRLCFNSSASSEATYHLVAIGSWIHAATPNSYIWGAGVRTWPPIETCEGEIADIARTLKVCAVRGPLTLKILKDLGAHTDAVQFGDPALLLDQYYKPKKCDDFNNEVILIPNISQIDFYANHPLPNGFTLMSPLSGWREIATAISSSKAVVSGSLHGLILADMYGIPNTWLVQPRLPEGYFKFLDYFASQGREVKFATTPIEAVNSEFLYDGGNKVDLGALVQVFPFNCRHSSTNEMPLPGLLPKQASIEWYESAVISLEASRNKDTDLHLATQECAHGLVISDGQSAVHEARDRLAVLQEYVRESLQTES